MFTSALSSHPDWERFLNEYWGRKPFLFSNVLPRPLFAERDLLRAYCTARARQVESARSASDPGDGTSVDRNVLVYLERKEPRWTRYRATAELARMLPNPDDRDCGAYVARVCAQERCTGVAAHLRYNLQGYNPEVLAPAEELTAPLFERVGFPGCWTLDCYLGRYDSTAFGVHQDLVEDQLYVSPVAPKTIHLWSPERWTSVENPTAYRWNYRAHPATPTSFVIGPRDVAYWPRHSYHIGESPDVALSVQINMRPRLTRGQLTDLVAAAPDAIGYRTVRPSSVAHVAATAAIEAEDVRRRLVALVNEPSVIAHLDTAALIRQSAHFVTNAFNEVEIPFALPLARAPQEATWFRAHPTRKVVWLVRGEVLVVACNGTSFEFRSPAEIRPLLEATLEEVNRDEAFSLNDLVERVGERLGPIAASDVPTFGQLLSALVAAGFVEGA